MPKRILVTGGRHWTNEHLVYGQLAAYPLGTILGHGDDGDENGKVGLDRMAARIATMLGFVVKPYPADWDGLGKAAGPKRNIQMLEAEAWDEVIGFHDNIATSLGTKHCLREAIKRGIPARLVTLTDIICEIPEALIADTRVSAAPMPKTTRVGEKRSVD